MLCYPNELQICCLTSNSETEDNDNDSNPSNVYEPGKGVDEDNNSTDGSEGNFVSSFS